ISSTNPSCGSATGSVTLTFANHPNRGLIEFSLDGGATWPSAYNIADNAGSLVINNLAAGDYDIQARWGNDECPVELGTANLSDLGGPTVDAGVNVTICEGETATLMASATGVAPFSYEWNNGLGNSATVSVSPVLPTFKNKGFNYTVTVTDANGCTGTDVVKVNVRSLPDVTVSSTDPSCLGNDGSITFTFEDHPNRSNIEFSIDGGATWPSSLNVVDNIGSFTLSNLPAASYDLQVRWGNNECPLDLPNVDLNATNGGCASLGDFVWYDNDRDGVQGLNEPGVQGVTVRLFKCGETNPIASLDTDVNGAYLFDNLLPNMSYYVEFDVNTLPLNYIFTGQNASGDEATDSDADVSGVTACVTLGVGENNTDLDAGIFQPVASLGDFVFNDINKNGIQDGNEPGIGGVQVTLTDCNNNFVAQTTTLSDGSYAFAGLNPGDYKVTFTNSSLPSGFVFTLQFAGGNDALDSDVNPSTGMTDCITLQPGENNSSIDAGAYLSATCTADAGTLTIACPSAIFCRQFGRATIYGWQNNDAVVPSGYTIVYLLTTGAAQVIQQTKAYPEFEVTANGSYEIHQFVYNNTLASPDYFSLATIALGTTTINDVYAMLLSGGGSLCGDIDLAGTAATVITCVDPPSQDDFAFTTVNTPVSGDLRANDGNPYGHPLSTSIFFGTFFGTTVVDENGMFTYTPNPGFVGRDSARYRLRDTTLCNHRNSFAWLYITVSETENIASQEPFDNGPVVFLDINVEKDGMANVLTWTTLEDTVALTYEVERSFDNMIYERVMQVDARGMANTPEEYEFVEDGTPYQELPAVYYRVRTVDPQGYFTFSETAVLNQGLIEPLLMEVYPVPAQTDVFVTWSLRDEPAKISLMNGLGQTLSVKNMETGSYETSFDVTRLTPGVYYLQVQAGGYLTSKSFVVEK
ncbi:MAG: carboxypeptidase regulatory-like domain-containing protein, partial [Bacteroidia bacterium]|nr:carboxypeptidase regulatory-like domain-containing protein [Bacteroidia bacterium]